MLTFFIVVFTLLLILDCLFLGLLILIQLPKKEAGAGMAFGGGAADALFGAGSGTALTKLTKWCTVFFFVLIIGLSIMNIRSPRSQADSLKRELDRPSATQPTTPVSPAVAPTPTPGSNALPASNAPALILPTTPSAAPVTNAVTNATTNAPAPVR